MEERLSQNFERILSKELVLRFFLNLLTLMRTYFFFTDDIQLILEDVDSMGVDISPLNTLLEFFFKLTFYYDQAL